MKYGFYPLDNSLTNLGNNDINIESYEYSFENGIPTGIFYLNSLFNSYDKVKLKFWFRITKNLSDNILFTINDNSINIHNVDDGTYKLYINEFSSQSFYYNVWYQIEIQITKNNLISYLLNNIVIYQQKNIAINANSFLSFNSINGISIRNIEIFDNIIEGKLSIDKNIVYRLPLHNEYEQYQNTLYDASGLINNPALIIGKSIYTKDSKIGSGCLILTSGNKLEINNILFNSFEDVSCSFWFSLVFEDIDLNNDIIIFKEKGEISITDDVISIKKSIGTYSATDESLTINGVTYKENIQDITSIINSDINDQKFRIYINDESKLCVDLPIIHHSISTIYNSLSIQYINTNFVINTNTFYMITFTFSKGIFKLYVNDELIASNENQYIYENSQLLINNICIEADVNNIHLSDFKIFNVFLTDKDVYDNYHTIYKYDDEKHFYLVEMINDNPSNDINFTRKGVINSNDFNELSNSAGMEYEIINGEIWYKLLYHNSNTNEYFTPNNVINNSSENLFSRLNLINSFIQDDNTYEMKIKYPNENLFIHFIQDTNPIKTISVPLLCTIIDKNFETSNNPFVGLHLSVTGNSYLSGSYTDDEYSIGSYNQNIVYGIEELWIKLNSKFDNNLKLYKGNYLSCNEFIEY